MPTTLRYRGKASDVKTPDLAKGHSTGMLSGMSNNQVFTERILRRPEVLRMTGLSRSTLYARIAASAFPRSIRISPGCVGWRLSDLHEWLIDPINYKL
jgi:prophage regulatory protein